MYIYTHECGAWYSAIANKYWLENTNKPAHNLSIDRELPSSNHKRRQTCARMNTYLSGIRGW
jgi:hypothetical protein